MNSTQKEPSDISINIEKVTKNFNDNLKDFQPIAFLGSLSLIIATFSGIKFGSAQDYAITAGFCFLLAFLTSLVMKVLNLNWYPYLSLIPILFNSFGVIFLFLVSWEFAKASVLLTNVIEITKFLPVVIIFIIVSTRQDFYRKFKLSSIRSVKILNIVLLLISIMSCIILFAYTAIKLYSLFGNIEINYPFLKNGLLVGIYLAGIAFYIDTLIIFVNRFDEKRGLYKHSLSINDAINYNSSLGIIFVSFNMIYNNFSFLDYLGYFMILVMNFILIIIKIKILPSLYRKII